jgi:hypothetical protein
LELTAEEEARRRRRAEHSEDGSLVSEEKASILRSVSAYSARELKRKKL